MKQIKNLFFVLTISVGISLSATAQTKMNLGEPLPANIFIELAKIINPAVVNISTATMPRRTQGPRGQFRGQDPFNDLFEQFFGPMGPMQRMPQQPQQALGTGFIIRADGLIVTNNHVIQGADVIRVQLNEKEKTLYTAELIGSDQRTDLALIKIDAKKPLPVAKLGASKDVQVGEWVAAFGNPLGLGHTTTKGIVSAIGRDIGELNRFPFIQTDASINPGNSGGPLVNMKGEVIGVNSAIAANGQGIGFAIPIDEAKVVLTALEKEGIVRRGYVGVNMYPYPVNPEAAQEMKLPTTEGALIVGVIEGSPAAKAGLKEYDFVVKFNGKEIKNSEDFRNAVADTSVGQTYTVDYYRQGKKQTAKVKPEEHPEDQKQIQKKRKTYLGQKAPFDLGFQVANYTQELGRELGLPQLRKPYPVVVAVEFDSPAAKAGLSVGDIIVDVNREETATDVAVIKRLRNKQINSLRVLRGQYPMLIYLSAK